MEAPHMNEVDVLDMVWEHSRAVCIDGRSATVCMYMSGINEYLLYFLSEFEYPNSKSKSKS